KFLALRSRGQIARNGAPNFELAAAADNLASGAAIAEKARSDQGNRELQEVSNQVVASLERAATMLKSPAADGLSEIRRTQKQRLDELLQRARVISNVHPESGKWSKDLNAIALELSREESILRESYANASALAIENLDANSQAAYERFSEKSRWERSESLLLHPLTGLLREVAAQHRIELRSLDGPGSSWIWRSENPAKEPLSLPDSFDSAPTNGTTDLAAILRTIANDKHEDQRVAVVILSDGQHNSGASVVEAAQALGRAGVPIYGIGFGSTIPPADEALIGVRAPESLSLQDRMKGELIVKDELPVGQAFTVRIKADGADLWSKTLVSEGRSRRNIPYDFHLEQAIGGLEFEEAGLKIRHKTLNLRAIIDPAKNEICQTNNEFRFAVQVVREKPKIFLLDESQSWEFRFLQEELERSGHWRVDGLRARYRSAVIPGNAKAKSLFPTKETLSSCAALVMGCINIEEVSEEELQSISDFVEKGGGTLLLIDDSKHGISQYVNSSIRALLPVQWENPPTISGAFQIRMPQIERAPLSFSFDPRTNALVWGRLPGPRSTAHVSPKGGSETLLELIGGEKPLPALVSRDAGFGRVLYLSFNETWRWFYGAGSYYHAQFWNQLLKSSADAAYAMENETMALDAGDSMYKPNTRVMLRAKWINPGVHSSEHAKVEAHLFRDHLPLAVIHLNPDQHRPGTFFTQTAELSEGEYEVRLQVDDLPLPKPGLTVSFLVQKDETTELAALTCNEPLLREMAALSGGAYLREEEAGRLPRMLQTISQGRVVESQTLLWQSWWWFGAIVLLFAVEWSLRKRGGLL
ncbi:MAG: hypothetical protein JWM99_3167, partial [Verrucomicrobiales bacterium]|nr:hypothetical protein [Verrucomicrobiales bacterium]